MQKIKVSDVQLLLASEILEPRPRIRETCSVSLEDASIRLVWDIDVMHLYISKTRRAHEVVVTDKLWNRMKNSMRGSIDKSYAKTTNPTMPGILVELGQFGEFLIDGKHRLFRAHHDNVKLFPVYRFVFKEHLPFLLNKDMVQDLLIATNMLVEE